MAIDQNRMAMLAIFVGELNAAIEAELGSSTERPNLDDILVARLRRAAQAVRTRVAQEFKVDEAEIQLPTIHRGVDDLVVDLPDEQRRAWQQVMPPQIPEHWRPGTCAECARLRAAEDAESSRADIAEEEVARLERQLLMVARAFSLIKDRASWLAVHTNEPDTLNTATIIEHIVEAADGDEGAAASLRVLGVDWKEVE